MNFAELHDWRSSAGDLGLSIPDSPHAVSVCLPLWAHNIGYEEGDASVTDRMQTGYPRFFLHPLVRKLMAECDARLAREGERCLVFPSARAAERCAEFVGRRTGADASVHELGPHNIFATVVPRDVWRTALEYWQHSGEIVSSRRAERALGGETESKGGADGEKAKRTLRQRIAGLAGARPEDVYLYPSGMAAVYAAYRAFSRIRPGLPSVQLGFPYVDTLKIHQKFGSNGEEDSVFLPGVGPAELERLEVILEEREVAAVFTEFPCNPLLTSPDLGRVSAWTRARRVPLLVDDTLATFVNADVLPLAEAVASSLTKFFSGSGDVIGGSLVLNAHSPLYSDISAALAAEHEDLLFDDDAVVLERNSRDFAERVLRINQTAEQLCDALSAHPRVARVHFAKYSTAEAYRAQLKAGGGYGGLFSLDLHDAPTAAPAFFDRLRICKGPNLGTNFTLCCPYTILAHYRELEFVERCGVSRYLLRVSTGLEDPEWLIERFSEALDGAK